MRANVRQPGSPEYRGRVRCKCWGYVVTTAWRRLWAGLRDGVERSSRDRTSRDTLAVDVIPNARKRSDTRDDGIHQPRTRHASRHNSRDRAMPRAGSPQGRFRLASHRQSPARRRPRGRKGNGRHREHCRKGWSHTRAKITNQISVKYDGVAPTLREWRWRRSRRAHSQAQRSSLPTLRLTSCAIVLKTSTINGPGAMPRPVWSGEKLHTLHPQDVRGRFAAKPTRTRGPQRSPTRMSERRAAPLPTGDGCRRNEARTTQADDDERQRRVVID